MKGAKGEVDQLVQFTVYESADTIVFMAKSSAELDKLVLVEETTTGDTIIKFLESKTNLKFKWDLGYNRRGAGYGFKIDYDSILKKL